MFDDIKNQIANEVTSPYEASKVGEAVSYPEFISPEENHIVFESDNSNPIITTANKRSKTLKILTGTFVTAGAAATFGVTTLINVEMKAQFNTVEYLDGSISYEISIDNLKDKQSLFLHFTDGEKDLDVFDITKDVLEAKHGVYSSKFSLSSTILDEINLKTAENNTSVTYNLILSGDVGLDVKRTFDSYAVEFYHAESIFEKVEGECHCSVDGYYYFQIYYKDDYGIFSDFKAYIEDLDGNTANCVELNDLNAHNQHKISVVDLKSSSCKLYVSYSVEGDQTSKIVVTNIHL